MARRKKGSPPLGAAGTHAGLALTPDDYEAMIEEAGDCTYEETLGVSPARAREIEAEVRAMTVQAEVDIAARDVRVNFRWEAAPLDVVKKAAAVMGVPYQTYIKQVLFQRAVEDITRFQAALGNPRPGS